jgi:hypothetical protein
MICIKPFVSIASILLTSLEGIHSNMISRLSSMPGIIHNSLRLSKAPPKGQYVKCHKRLYIASR